MQPQQNTVPLTAVERCLLDAAARVLTAFQYRDAHPEKLHLFFNDNLETEMVRCTQILCCLITPIDCAQTHIVSLYQDNHNPDQGPHRVHPAISALQWEYLTSINEQRAPNYDTITTRSIEQRVAAVNMLWPQELRSLDLSARANSDLELAWWLRDLGEEDNNNNNEGQEQEQNAEHDDEEEGEEEAQDAGQEEPNNDNEEEEEANIG